MPGSHFTFARSSSWSMHRLIITVSFSSLSFSNSSFFLLSSFISSSRVSLWLFSNNRNSFTPSTGWGTQPVDHRQPSTGCLELPQCLEGKPLSLLITSFEESLFCSILSTTTLASWKWRLDSLLPRARSICSQCMSLMSVLFCCRRLWRPEVWEQHLYTTGSDSIVSGRACLH